MKFGYNTKSYSELTPDVYSDLESPNEVSYGVDSKLSLSLLLKANPSTRSNTNESLVLSPALTSSTRFKKFEFPFEIAFGLSPAAIKISKNPLSLHSSKKQYFMGDFDEEIDRERFGNEPLFNVENLGTMMAAMLLCPKGEKITISKRINEWKMGISSRKLPLNGAVSLQIASKVSTKTFLDFSCGTAFGLRFNKVKAQPYFIGFVSNNGMGMNLSFNVIDSQRIFNFCNNVYLSFFLTRSFNGSSGVRFGLSFSWGTLSLGAKHDKTPQISVCGFDI